ncbi:unnamed protein product, partial [Pylaiella littoralis]
SGSSFSGGAQGAGAGTAGELPQTAAVMGGVLDALLQRTLSSMAGYVPLPAIVKKVVSDHAGSSLGEFRHVILAMLDTYSYDTAIHRTATSLLFDSLRTVVLERHTLKGKGVRVSAVAGVHLHPPLRLVSGNTGNSSASSNASASASAISSGALEASAATLAASYSADGAGTLAAAEGGGGASTTPAPPVPAGLVDAVGSSGVISVSPSGLAVVEHLGRRGSSARQGGGEIVASGGRGGGGEVRRGATPSAASQQQDAPVSLWRLRAARRRRQARGNKMRALVGWSAGQRGRGRDGVGVGVGVGAATNASWKSSPDGGGGDEGGRGGGRGANPAARGRRSSSAAAAAAAAAGGTHHVRGRAGAGGQQQQQQQALGWGSALQARALSGFLPKRT